MVQADSGPSVAILGLTESQVTTQLRAYLLTVLPNGTEIVLGQANLVSAPLGTFIVMTIIGRERLYTNDWSYGETTRIVNTPTRITVQVSAFGSGAGDLIQSVFGLWRDFYTTDFFAGTGLPITALDCSEPRQVPFITAERQYADHWNVDLRMQANVAVTLPQQLADSIKADAVSVESLTSSEV